MTIAYVLKMYPRFSETFIVNEILELERQGVDLRIYSLHKPNDGRFHASLSRVRAPVIYLPEYLPAEPTQILSSNFAEMRRHPRRYWRVMLYALWSRSPIKEFRRFLRAGVLADHLHTEPVQHLHAHFASSAARVAMFASLLTDVPYSFTAHAKDIFLNDVDNHLLCEKIRAAKFVVTVSDFNRNFLAQLIQQSARPVPLDRIRRLYNGIDLAQFDFNKESNLHEPLILAVGRLVEKKGLDVLIRACAILRDQRAAFRCEIIGKGPQETKLRSLVQELGLSEQVLLVGPKPQEQVVRMYQHAAVFALPCIVGADGNRDGLPTVLLEAMAMQLPVVSTDVTGIPEIVNDGVNGHLVPQKDPTALAAALAHLLSNPSLREKMGQAGRQTVVNKFDLTKNVSVLKQWLSGEISEPAQMQLVESERSSPAQVAA